MSKKHFLSTGKIWFNKAFTIEQIFKTYIVAE
jgi:hypothetical protein